MTTILILAGDTDGNIGDRAIVASTCEELRRLRPEIDIWLVSGQPAEDRDYFQARTIRRGPTGLPRLLQQALKSDGVLCGGGGLFQDDASLIKMPYWAARLVVTRLVGARVTGLSIGVGPLRHRTSRLAARLAFATMDRISVRDRLAQSLASELTSKTVELVPDPALNLQPAPIEDATRLLSEYGLLDDGKPLIGIAARQWFHLRSSWIPHKLIVQYGLREIPGHESRRTMFDLLARTLDEVAQRHQAHLLFLPTYNVTHEADDQACSEVMRRLATSDKTLLRIEEPKLYKAVTGHLQVMLASRMHASIFAAAMGTPVVGLSYNPKFEGFFQLIGRSRQVLRIEDFVTREMTAELSQLLTDALDQEHPERSSTTELGSTTRRFLAEFVEQIDPSGDSA